jgi:haloalkane dehalogenase
VSDLPVFRTPDSAFAALPDWPYAPRYLEWDGLRTHYVDEGPPDAPVALLLHGEPTWAYLYRSMIPPLLAAGYRCVAPDHIGFGRSDKVTDDAWYTAPRHIDRLRGLIERLDLRQITLFVQDWGGPIGLVNATAMPERFARLAIMNTWLHHEGFEYGPGIRAWRAAATNPMWLAWTRGDLPCGAIVERARARREGDPEAIRAAYEAPFAGNPAAKAGARRFPFCIPFAEPEAGGAALQQQAYAALAAWQGPVHLLFGTADRVFPPDWGRAWAATIPGATFDAIERAGHFVQEDAGPEVVACLLERIRHAKSQAR